MSVELAWAAGLFDGEGCVRIYQQTKTNAFVLQLVLVNTNLKAVTKFHEIMGVGSISEKRRYATHHKQCWAWQASAQKGKIALEKLLEYSVIKKPEIAVALEFMNLPKAITGPRMSEEEIKIRNGFLNTLKDLKKSGVI